MILINEGFDNSNLIKVCQKLQKKGIKIKVVSGGLNRWSQISQNFVGNKNLIKQWVFLEPRKFYYALYNPNNLLVSFSEIKKITELIKQNNKIKQIFIYDYQGEFENKMMTDLHSQSNLPLFYLKGGEIAFNHYQQTHLTLLNKLKYPSQLLQCRN
jgi:hypothetical protein